MEQIIVFSTLAVALILFMWGKLRHDLVAVISLLALVLTGVVEAKDAFNGFAHPAVITVAAVLLVSRGLQNTGLIDALSHWMMKIGKSFNIQILVLTAIVCLASGFMNNVGALAILMPVAIHLAHNSRKSPSLILMPIAFGSLLGGMITLIGTPPNIIIASFRVEAMGTGYNMFDFSTVGIGVSLVGVLFISFIGWRLLPQREAGTPNEDRFHIREYLTEVKIIENSILIGASVIDIKILTGIDINILGLIRNKKFIHNPKSDDNFLLNDILIVEADSRSLKRFIETSGTHLVGKMQLQKNVKGEENLVLAEVVIMPNSPMIDNTAMEMKIRNLYSINLLALARRDRQILNRLGSLKFKAGDVLLIQGHAQKIEHAIHELGCLPLADRGFTLAKPKSILLAVGIFALAIVLVIIGLLEVQIAFSLAALLMITTKLLPLRDIYTSIDWPVILLLGAMLPVGAALESSGGAEMIAANILKVGNNLPLWATMTVIISITMLLSGVINNAATVVLMAPIGISIAQGMNLSPDPFLMTIAFGASAAFLTPIGHQSNTLVMGPGGYKFSDYLKMGLPVSILFIASAIPLIMFFWL